MKVAACQANQDAYFSSAYAALALLNKISLLLQFTVAPSWKPVFPCMYCMLFLICTHIFFLVLKLNLVA